MRALIQRLLFLSLASGALAGGAYLTTDAFSARWRSFVVGRLQERGVHIDFDGVSLNPLGGLVARNVRLFNDAERQHLVASVDRLNLDFDYGQLLNKKVEVESLELSHANVSLPIDPEKADSTVVRLEDLNARVFLQGNMLELKRAEGVLGGVRLALSGALKLAPPPKTKEEKERAKKSAKKRLELIRDHRMQIQSTLNWLAQFKFEREPQLIVEVNGDVEKADQIRARLTFLAPGLTFGNYVCEEFSIEAGYDAGLVDLKRVYLKDPLGDLTASAYWRRGAESLKFELSSSANLPELAATFLKSDVLREVVFYEPPHLSLEGQWFIDGPNAGLSRPVRAVGQLQSGRFSSRGEIFEGLALEAGAAPEGIYLRDVELRHKSGSLAAQAMVHEEQGIRYRARLQMDPHVFLPFIGREQTRKVIQRFGFRAESSILLDVEGRGPTTQFADCKNWGRGEFGDFTYQGVEMKGLSADLELFQKIIIFRDLEVEREEGTGRAKEVYVDDGDDWLRLTGVETKLDTVAIISCFAPPTAAAVAKYRLPDTTEVSLEGTIGWKDNSYNDFVVNFKVPDGSGTYRLWDEDYRINSPRGKLTFKETMLGLQIDASLFGEPLRATGKVNVAKGSSDYDITVKAGTFPYEVFGEELSFKNMTAKVASRSKDLTFDIDATLLEGSATCTPCRCSGP